MYEGSDISLLKAVVWLTYLKCEFNLPYQAVDGFASLMKVMCPTDNEMTTNFYGTKKLLVVLKLAHRKSMHAPMDASFSEDLKKCLVCSVERYIKEIQRGQKNF